MPFDRGQTSRPAIEFLEDRLVPAIARPLLFVPGQPASVPISIVQAATPEDQLAAFDDFISQLGAKPWELTSLFDFSLFGLVQATSPTNALVETLVNLGGYTLFENDGTVNPNLFVAAQDWRMQVAPFDGVDDGILTNLTAQSIADDVFATDLNGNPGIYRYGVDYLGYWMIKAMDAWVLAGGDPSVGVDVISHSEGYLITRSYVSSAAYGGTYTGTVSGTLPTIANWISLAGPNEGASGIYNLLQNNFSNSLGSDLAGGLYMFEEAAYLRVTDPLTPLPIFGPDGSPLITPADVATGAITTGEFIQLYIGSLRDEMPTYAFLDGHDVNHLPEYRNNLLLDVNGGSDPNEFAGRVTESFTAIFGTRMTTLTTATTQVGAGGTKLALENVFDELVDVVEMLASGDLPPTQPGDVWLQDHAELKSGDGVAALRSTLSTFMGDPRITVLAQDRPDITHNATVSDPYVHHLILNIVQPGLLPDPPPYPTNASSGVGVFRNGKWRLDVDHDGMPGELFQFGGRGDTPVVGDWDGAGNSEIGVYRNGRWRLDVNGNGVWDGPTIDSQYRFGSTNQRPIIGDWTATGFDCIGTYARGVFRLDLNGNGVWDGPVIDRRVAFGVTGKPVIGDWDNDGIDDVGVYRKGVWHLDYNGNGAWDGPSLDRRYHFGVAGQPAPGDWNGSGQDLIGVFFNGTFYQDRDGDGRWDGGIQDRQITFGSPASRGVAGYWDPDNAGLVAALTADQRHAPAKALPVAPVMPRAAANRR